MESNLPRAPESAPWTPKVALVRVRPRPPSVSGVFHRGPCVSSRSPRPAALDQSAEGPRSLPTRRWLREQGLLVLRLLQLRRVLFAFPSPSRPVNSPEFLAGLGHLQLYLWALRTRRSFKARLPPYCGFPSSGVSPHFWLMGVCGMTLGQQPQRKLGPCSPPAHQLVASDRASSCPGIKEC